MDAHIRCVTPSRQLLDHGRSLKEVADVLRHFSLNTSRMYTKLDTPRLAAVDITHELILEFLDYWERGRHNGA